MDEIKELLQKAIDVMDHNSSLANMMIKKALKQLTELNDIKAEEWENEAVQPEILRGKVF